MTEHNVKVQEWVIRFDGNITHKQAALEIDLGETGDDMQGSINLKKSIQKQIRYLLLRLFSFGTLESLIFS